MSDAAYQTVIESWNTAEPPKPPEVKPVTVNAAKTALLMLDFLDEVCTPAKRPRAAAVMPRLKALLEKARAKGMTVVHSTTSSGTGSGDELAKDIRPIAGERVYKAPFDKFHGNDMADYLRGRGVDTLIITGTSANGCLLFTTAGAVLRGFKAVVPIDGMPAASVYQEQFVAWEIGNGPGLRAKATLTRVGDITFA